MKTKICSVCGKELPATKEHFYKDKRGKFGFYAKCKECHCKKTKNYYQRNEEFYKKYRDEHKEDMLKYNKEYRKKYKEKLNARKREYYQNNKHIYRRLSRKYSKENKDLININNQKRRAKKRKLPSNLSKNKWDKIKLHFNNKCAYCGQEKNLHQEHFIALSKGGEFTHNNIIPACKSCNCSKGNKDFFEWYPKQNTYSKKREKKILKFLNYDNGIQQLKLTL